METIVSTICTAPAPQCMPGRSWTQRLQATLKRWWVAYITWRIERAALAQLWSLSDRYLKDIGLTRSEILRAVKGETAAERRLPGSLRNVCQGCVRLIGHRLSSARAEANNYANAPDP